MKKSLLLGAFLAVAAIASAKEVVPAPVVVTEAPVKVVEKEVIVYRDRAPVGFRPNGYVDLQLRWYGETENKTKAEDNWAGNTKYSRIQLLGKINMTENQALEYRIRNFGNVSNEKVGKSGTDTRLRYFYNHGNVGDTNVNFTSRLHYRDREDTNGHQELEYQARFNFAEYMFNGEYVKTTNFVVAPKYRYEWGTGNNSTYDNQLGVDLYTMHELPWGFSFEFNLYATQHFYGEDQAFDRGRDMEDKNFTLDMEAYIYNTTNLYTNGDVTVDFNFEGGYDPYTWSKEKMFATSGYLNSYGYDDESYSLYALPTIQVNYQATPYFKVYAAAGAEYRNWTKDNGNSAKDWRWQPTVFAGFRATF